MFIARKRRRRSWRGGVRALDWKGVRSLRGRGGEGKM